MFIALEGGEGAGKTTAIAALAQHLPDPLLTREPGGTPEGLALRALLLSAEAPDWDPVAELLLMTAARVQHVRRVIQPALAAGRVVLCDRFVGSTLAYQGGGRGLDEGLILDLHARCVGDLWPDLTILLDVPPEVGLQRSVRRLGAAGSDEGRFEAEALAFHQRVRASFLAQAVLRPTLVVDASRGVEEVADAIVRGFRALKEGLLF
jgi:dTMP kinase